MEIAILCKITMRYDSCEVDEVKTDVSIENDMKASQVNGPFRGHSNHIVRNRFSTQDFWSNDDFLEERILWLL